MLFGWLVVVVGGDGVGLFVWLVFVCLFVLFWWWWLLLFWVFLSHENCQNVNIFLLTRYTDVSCKRSVDVKG